eukprot:3472359-Pleurochrysis_carterae.AAC.4
MTTVSSPRHSSAYLFCPHRHTARLGATHEHRAGQGELSCTQFHNSGTGDRLKADWQSTQNVHVLIPVETPRSEFSPPVFAKSCGTLHTTHVVSASNKGRTAYQKGGCRRSLCAEQRLARLFCFC